ATTAVTPTTTTTTAAPTTTTTSASTTTAIATTSTTYATINDGEFMEMLSRCGFVKNQADRNDCYGKAAVEYKNPLACDKIEVIIEAHADSVDIKPLQRDYCYTALAVMLGNATLCNNATNAGMYLTWIAFKYPDKQVRMTGNPIADKYCCHNVTGGNCTKGGQAGLSPLL
ncbi:MAG: hypothetical protein PHG85_07130, partial [Candidatus Altiarchaeota archaeon]|nr:hypothetical protein [Candidatus Altiarchaeota archaeon]